MASALPASSLSSYLYQKEANKYGGKQEEYLKRSEAAIQGAVQTMRSWIGSQKNPTELFFKIFEDLRKERADIALKHGTANAPHFGMLRNLEELLQGVEYSPCSTLLCGSTAEYSTILMQQLHQIMGRMNHTLTTFKGRKVSQEEQEGVLGCKVSFEVEVLGIDEPDQQKLLKAIDSLPTVLHTKKTTSEIVRDRQLMEKLKRKKPALYEKLNRAWVILGIKDNFVISKTVQLQGRTIRLENPDHFRSHYVLGTLKLNIQGKVYPLSGIATWLYQDGKKDSIDRMLKCSWATITHQEPLLIDETMQEISKLFKKAILWDPKKEDIKELKDRVALLRFVYALCMPCARGDGAIGDWLELAIYRFHGFDATRHSSKHLPCFEPLASLSLAHYRGRYDQVITVAKSGERSEEKKEETKEAR